MLRGSSMWWAGCPGHCSHDNKIRPNHLHTQICTQWWCCTYTYILYVQTSTHTYICTHYTHLKYVYIYIMYQQPLTLFCTVTQWWENSRSIQGWVAGGSAVCRGNYYSTGKDRCAAPPYIHYTHTVYALHIHHTTHAHIQELYKHKYLVSH